MKITKKNPFQDWTEYTLTNKHGLYISFLDYGGIITEIMVPDQHGKKENITLAYKDYKDYLENPNYFGAIIGRVAGRIQNGTFKLNGTRYYLDKNNGSHTLHGGLQGFHQVIWKTETFQHKEAVGVKLFHISPDQEGGFPGQITAEVTYTLTNKNQFRIDYKAVSTKDTVLTLTNHAYFNLSGDTKETIHQHHMTMPCSQFLPLNEELIPLGMAEDTSGTSFDFMEGNLIRTGINSDNPQNIIAGNGYDHYFLFNQEEEKRVTAHEPVSGRTLVMETTQPGLVFYTANNLEQGLNLKIVHQRNI